jgi:hypothetical protein
VAASESYWPWVQILVSWSCLHRPYKIFQTAIKYPKKFLFPCPPKYTQIGIFGIQIPSGNPDWRQKTLLRLLPILDSYDHLIGTCMYVYVHVCMYMHMCVYMYMNRYRLQHIMSYILTFKLSKLRDNFYRVAVVGTSSLEPND